jgi:hypothetical protein
MVYIYVLLLQDNKYYIGKTNTPYKRIQSHFNNDGSVWTKLNKPIDIYQIIPNCDDFDEDKYTLQYMEKYGIENVRGGSYTKVTLNTYDLNHINKILNSNNDKCIICGEFGHFANECKKKTNTSIMNMNKPKPDIKITYAKTNKSKCCICSNNIDKDDLKIGEMYMYFNEERFKWYHINCFMQIINKKFNFYELAKSGKSKCYICNELINYNLLRIGFLDNSKYGEITKWHHIECMCNNNITYDL